MKKEKGGICGQFYVGKCFLCESLTDESEMRIVPKFWNHVVLDIYMSWE